MRPLTDRAALRRNRARARRSGPALFLREAVAAEVQERLAEVNRRFTAPALVSPFPEVWAAILPGAAVVEDDEALALSEGAHDLVVHDLCLHWADDPVGQLAQGARALRPDGLLVATLFGGATLGALRAALAEAEAEATGGLSPRVLPMGEVRAWGDLLGRAGLALPVADAQGFDVSYPDALALMRELRAMGEGNALHDRLRRPTPRGVILGALARYPLVDGRAVARLEVVTLTAWAPGPGQPVPLRPGSRSGSLLDALAAAKGS